MRIGILGGTFDPIHIGHLALAQEAARQLKLDKVIFVPSYIPVHKMRKGILDARHRLRMVKLAIKKNKVFSASNIEIRSKKPCYTVDTLAKFRKKFKKDKLFFITGSDSVSQLSKWKDVDEIFRLAVFVVGLRPGFKLKKAPKKIKIIRIKPVDISSSGIRRSIRQKRAIENLVPESVSKYIAKNKLYR